MARDKRDVGFVKGLVRRRKLESIFLFVTSRCNSACRTCFYHDKLNDGADLTFDQIQQISQTAPRFDKLWLSGGEPFMRKELADIIRMFVDNNGVKVINLPTNGLLPDRLEQGVDRLLAECPELEIHLNLSLDGIGETHDHQRGVPGGFHKTLATLRRVRERYAGRPKLITNVATVITPANYDEVLELSAYLLQNDLCAVHLLEVVRGDPKDPATKALSRQQVQDLQDRFYVMNQEMSRRLFDDFNPVSKAIAEKLFLGFIRFLNGIQQDNLEGPSHWGMNCTAGETTLVVDHDGNFRSCEMRPPIGNLRDYGFDTTAVMGSRAMQEEIHAIGGGARANCWCTHGCWIISSMKFSPRAMLLRLPAAYIRARHLGQPDFVLPRVDPARFEPRPEPAAAEGGSPA